MLLCYDWSTRNYLEDESHLNWLANRRPPKFQNVSANPPYLLQVVRWILIKRTNRQVWVAARWNNLLMDCQQILRYLSSSEEAFCRGYCEHIHRGSNDAHGKQDITNIEIPISQDNAILNSATSTQRTIEGQNWQPLPLPYRNGQYLRTHQKIQAELISIRSNWVGKCSL